MFPLLHNYLQQVPFHGQTFFGPFGVVFDSRMLKALSCYKIVPILSLSALDSTKNCLEKSSTTSCVSAAVTHFKTNACFVSLHF